MAPVKGDSKLKYCFASVPGPEHVTKVPKNSAVSLGLYRRPALMKIPNLDESKVASCGFWWGYRNFDSQRRHTVNESLLSCLDGVGVSMEGKK